VVQNGIFGVIFRFPQLVTKRTFGTIEEACQTVAVT
jgi:hypothetical protein